MAVTVARSRSQGMALLTALVMLAIASTLAVSIWYNSQLSVARINNLQKTYQAKHYSQGLLLWASDLLREDYSQDEKPHDSSADLWLQGIQGMVVEDAVISGSLVGLNDRFNVNNLVIEGAKSEDHVAYFRQLLVALELDINIADKIIDWIDADQVPEPNGAEDFAYLAKSPSYQTSGAYFKHVEELALLDRMDSESFQQLAPYVSTLPITNQPTKMNVNTIPPILLSALHPQITDDKALRLYQNGQANFTDLTAFYAHESIQYVLDTTIRSKMDQLISTQTLHLQASSLVQMESSQFVMYALLQRAPTGNAIALSRSLNPYLHKPLIN